MFDNGIEGILYKITGIYTFSVAGYSPFLKTQKEISMYFSIHIFVSHPQKPPQNTEGKQGITMVTSPSNHH
jgi:hypothetical protein